MPRDHARFAMHYRRGALWQMGLQRYATDHKTVAHDLATPPALPDDTAADCQTVENTQSDD